LPIDCLQCPETVGGLEFAGIQSTELAGTECSGSLALWHCNTSADLVCVGIDSNAPFNAIEHCAFRALDLFAICATSRSLRYSKLTGCSMPRVPFESTICNVRFVRFFCLFSWPAHRIGAGAD
jgi:hypothetical protein